jgi:hypothetical protein
MTIDTQTMATLVDIQADVEGMQAALTTIDEQVALIEADGVVVPTEVDNAFGDINTGLSVLLTWVMQTIEDGNTEVPVTVMQQFLSELKAVFDKYSATIERLDPASYGTSYGSASVFRFNIVEPETGTLDSKEIVVQTTDVIAGSDLAV